jgi:hypothetical protein
VNDSKAQVRIRSKAMAAYLRQVRENLLSGTIIFYLSQIKNPSPFHIYLSPKSFLFSTMFC